MDSTCEARHCFLGVSELLLEYQSLPLQVLNFLQYLAVFSVEHLIGLSKVDSKLLLLIIGVFKSCVSLNVYGKPGESLSGIIQQGTDITKCTVNINQVLVWRETIRPGSVLGD